jgi:hypothetical protein
LSALLVVNRALGTTTTLETEPTELVIGTATAVTGFDNDTKVKEYTVDLLANKVYNISLANANGTALKWSIFRSDMPFSADSTVLADCCGCILSDSVAYYYGAGRPEGMGPGGDMYYPKNDSSQLIVAVEKITLKICVIVAGVFDNWYNVNTMNFASASGSLLVREVQDLAVDGSKIASTVTSLSVNFSTMITSYATRIIKILNVAETGWYLLTQNTTHNPDAGVGEGQTQITGAFLELGTADVATMCSDNNIIGTFRAAWSGQWNTEDYKNNKFGGYDIAYLEKGKDYLMWVSGDLGSVIMSWSLLKTVEGKIGEDAISVNLASADITVVTESNNQKSAWVIFEDEFDFDTLYDVSASVTGLEWWNVKLDLNKLGAGTSPNKNMAFVCQMLILEDCVTPCYKIGKTAYAPSHKLISSSNSLLPTGGGIQLGGQNGTYKSWSTSTWGSKLTNIPLKVSATNETVNQWGLVGAVSVTVKKNADGVADFPETGAVITKTLDGAAGDTTGLYKLEKKAGKEIQFSLSGLSAQVNPTWTFEFVTCWDNVIPCVAGGAQKMRGTTVESWGSTSFTVTNTTYLHSTVAAWDSAKIREVLVYNDVVYVLITASNPDDGLVPGTNNPNQVNVSSITVGWEEEAFLANKKEFIVSRDNKLQAYSLSMSPCAYAQLVNKYGKCCSLSATAYAVPKKWNCVGAVSGLSSISITQIKANVARCKIGSVYLVLTAFGSGTSDGSILQLIITNVSVGIPGYSVFFTTLATLGVVVALIVKRKQH